MNLKKNGIDKNKFITTIKNLKYSNNVVNYYVSKNLSKNSFFFSLEQNKIIFKNDFFHQPHEIIFRGLSESIRVIGKKYYSARGKKIDKVIESIKQNNSFKATLGGCIIEKSKSDSIYKKRMIK